MIVKECSKCGKSNVINFLNSDVKNCECGKELFSNEYYTCGVCGRTTSGRQSALECCRD